MQTRPAASNAHSLSAYGLPNAATGKGLLFTTLKDNNCDGSKELAASNWECRTFSAFNGLGGKGFLLAKVSQP